MSAIVRAAERTTREWPPVATADGSGILHRPAHRFSVSQYHAMIETGILTGNDRVELLDGWIIEKMTYNPPHNAAMTRTNRRMSRLLPDQWLLLVGGAITLRSSEPEPDFAIVDGPDGRYSQRKPLARDVRLIIEVADSTLLFDRRWKLRMYAQARVSEYWIINLVESCVEVYTAPKGGRAATYRKQEVYVVGQSVPLTLDGQHIADIPVRDLLPV
jgi:Uma2 family endonuclease